MDANFDVIFVGAGPASLAGAIHLKKLAQKSPALKNLSIAVIEKAPGQGDHTLSGAVLGTETLEELIPDFMKKEPPLGPIIKKQKIAFLTKQIAFRLPIVPPPMKDLGKRLVSLSDLVRWLGTIAEKEGVELYTGEAVDELLMEGEKVTGVKIRGKGINREGNPGKICVPAVSIGAKVVVLGEGSRGHLTKELIEKLALNKGSTPQGHAVGIKELWELDEEHFEEGTVINTMGYPIPLSSFGGSFVYFIKERLVAIGLVVGLDWKDPHLHPFELMQRFKKHPYISKIIKGGRFVAYGAKTITEGGYYAMPKLYGDGFMIIGESAGILDPMKLKGIEHGMKSGMLSAETIMEAATKNDFSKNSLKTYDEKLKSSWVGADLWRSRNFHQGFHSGLIPGMIHAFLQFITKGRGLVSRFKGIKPDALCMRMLKNQERLDEECLRPDNRTIFDKLTCVYGSGTKHEEDQPCHIKIADMSICNGICREEYGNPCQYFCPANVFEMIKEEDGKTRLHLNPANCLHCKTCDIKDPYEIVTWAPPEGGGGPNYKGM
jgi:electron-transferring-flavoprotein dehydrogenase